MRAIRPIQLAIFDGYPALSGLLIKRPAMLVRAIAVEAGIV